MAPGLQLLSELWWERFSGCVWLWNKGCSAQPSHEETTGAASALQSVPAKNP